jgi:hypothetical protein
MQKDGLSLLHYLEHFKNNSEAKDERVEWMERLAKPVLHSHTVYSSVLP